MLPVTTTSGGELRGVAQDLRNQHAPLPVDRGVLAVVVDALEKLVLRAVNRRKLGELLLERAPDRQRIEKEVAAVDRRDEEIASERLFDLLPEEIRHLEPALLVETGRRASSKAIHPSVVVPLECPGPLSPTFSQIWPLARMLGAPRFISQAEVVCLKKLGALNGRNRIARAASHKHLCIACTECPNGRAFRHEASSVRGANSLPTEGREEVRAAGASRSDGSALRSSRIRRAARRCRRQIRALRERRSCQSLVSSSHSARPR